MVLKTIFFEKSDFFEKSFEKFHANNRNPIENWMVFRPDVLGNSAREINKKYVTSCFMWDQPLREIWGKSHADFLRTVPS